MLPATAAPMHSEGEPPPMPRPDAGSAGPRRILVIDDEPLVGALVVSGLRGHGYDVVACASPEAGISAFQSAPESFDLVLLDMVMPRVPGTQVFHALRIVRPDVPVLLMSGYSLDRESEGLVALGAAGFLQKPFTVRDLVRSLRDAFASVAAQAR